MKFIPSIVLFLALFLPATAIAQKTGTVKYYSKISAADTSLGHSTKWWLALSVCQIHDMDGDSVNELAASSAFGHGGFVYLFKLNKSGKVKSYTAIGEDSSGMIGYLPTNFQGFGGAIADMGDFNGDGIDEMAVGDIFGGPSYGQGEVFILFMNKSGIVDSFTQIREHHAGFNDTLSEFGGFGISVANIGDLDNDGVNDLAVGNSGFQIGKGSVWILFMKRNGTVKNARQISNISGDHITIHNRANFGTSVCRLGDLDGDGHPDIMVGDFKDSTQNGEAWTLFLNADGSVKSYYNYVPGTMTFPDTVNASGFFGYSVASIGDIDGDSVTDVAIGAYQYVDSLGEMPGRVWIALLNKDGSAKATQIIDQYHGNLSGVLHDKDNFGCSLATIGDFNKDGIFDLAVGAQDDDDANPANPDINSGAIYFLYLNGVPINTGIGDVIYNTTKGFFVYPNPSSDMMIIRSKDPNEMIGSAYGFDLNGKECFEYKGVHAKSLKINVLNLPAGDYFIKVNTLSNTSETIHFVKH